LRAIYASGIDRDGMRRRKAEAFDALRVEYVRLRTEWGGHAPFDDWFDGEVNNADLASVATYYDCVPGFRRELAAVGGSLPAFYARVRDLAKLDQTRRDALVCGTN
jgi:predicted aminopeptidase